MTDSSSESCTTNDVLFQITGIDRLRLVECKGDYSDDDSCEGSYANDSALITKRRQSSLLRRGSTATTSRRGSQSERPSFTANMLDDLQSELSSDDSDEYELSYQFNDSDCDLGTSNSKILGASQRRLSKGLAGGDNNKTNMLPAKRSSEKPISAARNNNKAVAA
ncbi:expressed unknown protein [Seminavis robusta]|uniref:Uncharacterized protein n=1 Tax=Seminavis robusta TaxID=568900 RepID=A0A9N8DXA8_9STRA|nr:expressed unknown protein [Seminavis robusta]|eukprot:Sro316_g115500.1 n/a (165) ;mRNA; f:28323-28817